MEELGLDEEALLSEYSPDQLVPPDGSEEGAEAKPFVRAEQEARLKKAERSLDQLGRVNPSHSKSLRHWSLVTRS